MNINLANIEVMKPNISSPRNFVLDSLSEWPSDQTSSKTYSSVPTPGIGKLFVRPSLSMIASRASWTVNRRDRNSLNWKPSWISGTRKNENVKARNGCKDTRRRLGVCKCEVSGKVEKVLCD